MKKGMKNLASALLCGLLVLLAVRSAWKFLERKTSYVKNDGFYSYDGDFDVLFLGSSHMVMGVLPMELWKEYGIVSYNLANYGQWIPVDYWALKNALQYTKPKLVVLDVRAIDIDGNKYSPEHESQLHETFDGMPLSRTKASAIWDLLPKGKRMEYLFDFSIYHTRWNELDASFWKETKPSPEKGANVDNSNNFDEVAVAPILPPVLVDKGEMYMEETTGKEYLRKIIALCEEEEIELLLTALPHSPNEDYQRWLNSAQAIAEEYDVPYFDMITEDAFVNYDTDFFDDAHLNSSGAKKTTHELGKYVMEHYPLTDWRESEIAPQWERDYRKYVKFKLKWLKKQKDLKAYLMLLADRQWDIVLDIYDKSIFKDDYCVTLLENLGVDRAKLTEGADCIVIGEGGKSAEVIENFHASEGVTQTALGDLGLFIDEMDENGNILAYSITLDGEGRYLAPLQENAGLRVLVMDQDTLETADCASFSFAVEKQGYTLETTKVKREKQKGQKTQEKE